MGVSFREFACRHMFSLGNAFWVLISSFVVRIIWTLFAKFSWASNERNQISGVSVNEVGENPGDRNEAPGETFTLGSGFKSISEEENSFDCLSVSNATTKKYEFLSGNSFCGYIEEPRDTSFKVQELFLDSGSAFEEGIAEDSVITDHNVCRDLQEFDDQRKTGDAFAQEAYELGKSQRLVCDEPFLENDKEQSKEEVFVCSEPSFIKDFGEVPYTSEPSFDEEFAEVGRVKTDVFIYGELSSREHHRQVNDQGKREGSVCHEPSLVEDFQQADDKGETESSFIVSSYEDGMKNDVLILPQEELSEEEVIVGLQDGTAGKSGISSKSHVSCEVVLEQDLINLDPDEISEKEDVDAFCKEVQPSRENQFVSSDHGNQDPSMPSNDFWHTNGKFIADFGEVYFCQSDGVVLEPETPMCLDTKNVDLHQEDVSGSDSTDSDDQKDSVMNHAEAEYWENPNELDTEEKRNQVSEEDDEMDLDALLVHLSFVRKMKKEMKSSRSIGLPTILEESEAPRMDEDLKPLRIGEKMGYKDRLDEIQRFYKSYLDKMRRLDILCNQTTYAAGFLQLKNQDQLSANRKLSFLSIKSLLAHNLLPSKFRRNGSDPVRKLLRDLHRDLELVYVGQLCLSWEILKWQHAKAEELQLFDTMGMCRYSLVAAEFQQFQVLVRRFTEDEPFQGPRVENYVKNRCANCNLLQVPPIKDDSMNLGRKVEGRAIVSIVRLTDIIEESMHAFWGFIRADKKEASNAGLHDPLDARLLSDVRANLAKKERRLKDLVKTGNCLVKKFQRQQDYRLSHELLLAQVELRLVSRVIGMSRLTSDQLLWCQKKLGKISVVGRKVDNESSFLLFPC